MNLTELIKLERKKADKGWEYWTCGNYDTMYDYGTEIGYNQCLSDLKGIEIELDEAELSKVLRFPTDSVTLNTNFGIVNEYQSDYLARALSFNLSKILKVKKGVDK